MQLMQLVTQDYLNDDDTLHSNCTFIGSLLSAKIIIRLMNTIASSTVGVADGSRKINDDSTDQLRRRVEKREDEKWV